MDEQRSKLLKVALASGSFAIIVVGLAVALAGQWFGWLIAAFGALDAASIPFVLRAIASRRTAVHRDADASEGSAGAPPAAAPTPAEDKPVDPTADPSYNPYTRED